jgi:hypothetical protein
MRKGGGKGKLELAEAATGQAATGKAGGSSFTVRVDTISVYSSSCKSFF